MSLQDTWPSQQPLSAANTSCSLSVVALVFSWYAKSGIWKGRIPFARLSSNDPGHLSPSVGWFDHSMWWWDDMLSCHLQKVWQLMMFYQQCRLCTPGKAPVLARILGGLRMNYRHLSWCTALNDHLLGSAAEEVGNPSIGFSRDAVVVNFSGAVGYVQTYQRLYYSPWRLRPPVGHCLSCHVALARPRAVAFHMTGVRRSHAGFSAGFCDCPSVVRSGWPWYAPWSIYAC